MRGVKSRRTSAAKPVRIVQILRRWRRRNGRRRWTERKRSRQEATDRQDAIRQEATDRQDAIRQEAEDREEVKRQNEADCARFQSAKQKWEGLKAALKKLERERLEQLRRVTERLTERGIDVGHNKTHGDGVRFLRTLEPFHHLDEGAELVAFSPEDHPFSSGQTAGELREDVSDWLRRQKKQCQTTRSGRR